MAEQIPVITIDGPGGSGKGTIARLLGERLGWHFLDSGALYRVLGLYAERSGVALDDEAGLTVLAHALPVRFEGGADGARVWLADDDVTSEIRTEYCGGLASKVAALPHVRAALLERQRAFRQAPGLIADGRDMGTVVFPGAPVKIFLTATAEERARRRHKQLNEQGVSVNLSALLREIAERDERDASRAVAPLKPADDAEIVDTTEVSIASVVERVLNIAERRLGISLIGEERF
ncbi:cytidylate kinase [Alkalilimnicola ehrlichii]|uniref:Cytidylate kinase n=1 Tax=Alkalilimnicola ehrlichii TaxID=351052 RepID=A0A3E0WNP2_9GAMM|nr:(d)CMP kinase [Alkalilimnicola ehrlichii]RFA27760.1 cytidylate kinase [Alkalilimnicola ehrlichii]RFA33596.1 cytidylate kinase [Alkalilimnicola ehrlichii]